MNDPPVTPPAPRVIWKRPAAAIDDDAADWLARRHAGFMAAEEAEFRKWLAADPRHAAAFAELDKVWNTLKHPQRTGRTDTVLRELDRREFRRAQRRQVYTVSALGLAAAAIVLFMLPARTPTQPPVVLPTVTTRPNLQDLPDGSTVELNAGTEIEVAFAPDTRRVRLLRGEALFQVAKDPSRPFVVAAGDVEVRAVGTAFTVDLGQKSVAILVTQGRVAMERMVDSRPGADAGRAEAAASFGSGGGRAPDPLAPQRAERIYLDAGKRVIVQAGLPLALATGVKTVTPAEMAAALAWRSKRLEFTGTPLLEAMELFNQQNRLQLSVADIKTGNLQITGIFWVDDPEGLVRLLESGLNVKAYRTGDYIVLRLR